jgi:hypothetical protein
MGVTQGVSWAGPRARRAGDVLGEQLSGSAQAVLGADASAELGGVLPHLLIGGTGARRNGKIASPA